MRTALASALLPLGLLCLGLAQPTLAAPAVSAVKVSIGPELADRVDDIGDREFDILASELRRSVERKTPLQPQGGTLHLVIEDARPNRPTPRQLAAVPGLSLDSFGIGGAHITGQFVDAAGNATPIDYAWWETDIRWAPYATTWHDAESAFDRLAIRLAKDQFVQTR